MGKNKITEQLANNEVTLDLAFNNLLLVASVINNKELLKWVEHEISGYQENDILPLYRKSEKSLHFVYSGLNGTYAINSAPLPISYFSEGIRNEIVNIKILEGVKIIERQLAIKDSEWSAVRDCTSYAGDVYMNTGIQCFSIGQVLQKSYYEKAYNNIKVHLIKILLMIEKWYGSLDPAELESKKYERQKLAEAGKLISTYIIGLSDSKTDIPNPRISIANKTLDQKQNPDKAQQDVQPQQPSPAYQPQQPMPQQPAMPQMAPSQMPPSPMYQPQQPMPQQPAMPQMAPSQMSPSPMYQPQQPMPQQPAMPQMAPQMPPSTAYQPQQPQSMAPQPAVQQANVNQHQAGQMSDEAAFGKLKEQVQAEKMPVKDKEPVKPLVKEQERKADTVQAAAKEKPEKDDAAKAAEIRKDRIPKSLLDYLEEKKTELSKKTE